MHKIKSYSLILCLALLNCSDVKAPDRFKYCNHKGMLYERFTYESLDDLFNEVCEQINIRKNICDGESKNSKIIKKVKHKCFSEHGASISPFGPTDPLRRHTDPKEYVAVSFEENLKGMCILQSFVDISLKEEVFPLGIVYCLEGTYIVVPKTTQ